MTTLYWHDYETFGANPSLDRPAQFAGIRTDEELNPVGEPLEIFCRPTDDYLPHPEACLITGITPQLARERGVAEPAFIATIHRELAQPGTCGVGYNSLRFDDEVTRHCLYRNFFDPYSREWRYGNSRWDLIDVVRMCYALRPDGLQWPLNDRGAPSFRLEDLTQANGIAHQGAHDALADVRATIELARRVKAAQPRLYRYAFGLRGKRRVAELINPAGAHPLLHVSSRYPAARGCTALVLAVAAHPVNGNAVIVCDLSADPALLLDLDADELGRRLFSPREQLADGEAPVPLKLVHLNRSPMLVTPKVLDPAGYRRLGIDRQRCERHADILHGAAPLLAAKLPQLFDAAAPQSDDPETQLYAGFFGDEDRTTMAALRRAGPGELAQFDAAFSDERLAPLLFRYRARHYPESLSVPERERWAQWRQRRLTERTRNGGLVLADYFNMIAQELAQPDIGDGAVRILEALEAYGHALEQDFR